MLTQSVANGAPRVGDTQARGLPDLLEHPSGSPGSPTRRKGHARMGYWLGIDVGTTFTAPALCWQEAGRGALTAVIPLGTRFTAELGRPVAIDTDPQAAIALGTALSALPADTDHTAYSDIVGADVSPDATVPAAVGSTSASLAGVVQTQALLTQWVQQGQLPLIPLGGSDLGGRDPPRKASRSPPSIRAANPAWCSNTAPPSTPAAPRSFMTAEPPNTISHSSVRAIRVLANKTPG